MACSTRSAHDPRASARPAGCSLGAGSSHSPGWLDDAVAAQRERGTAGRIAGFDDHQIGARLRGDATDDTSVAIDAEPRWHPCHDLDGGEVRGRNRELIKTTDDAC